jgi:hypothetical protein
VEGSTVSADQRRLFLASFLMLFVELEHLNPYATVSSRR